MGLSVQGNTLGTRKRIALPTSMSTTTNTPKETRTGKGIGRRSSVGYRLNRRKMFREMMTFVRHRSTPASRR